jgi:hypothetical protein
MHRIHDPGQEKTINGRGPLDKGMSRHLELQHKLQKLPAYIYGKQKKPGLHHVAEWGMHAFDVRMRDCTSLSVNAV